MLSKTWHSAALSDRQPLLQPIFHALQHAIPPKPLYDDVPCTALLDLGDVELEEVVQPCDEFLSARNARSAKDRRLCHVGRVYQWRRPYLDSPILGGAASSVGGVSCCRYGRVDSWWRYTWPRRGVGKRVVMFVDCLATRRKSSGR
jgi:hypothetical protein